MPQLPAHLLDPHPERLSLDHPFRARIVAAHAAAVAAGEAGYEDPVSGLWVQTAATHWERGTCCGSGCRHCPWVVDPG